MGIPKESLDSMAEFVLGIRRWSEWPRWFAINAGRLVRVMDRGLFEQLKRDPEKAMADVFHQEQISIHITQPKPPSGLDDPISLKEYEVYTVMCRQQDLFLFNRQDTIVENLTAGDTLGNSFYRGMLEYNESLREYRVVGAGLVDRFSMPFSQWFTQYPEMIDQYESRNQRRWPMEKRFQVENGYRLVSEMSEQSRDLQQRAFCLSRVGFSTDGRFAFMFIRYAGVCSYYLVFEQTKNDWKRAAVYMSWIT